MKHQASSFALLSVCWLAAAFLGPSGCGRRADSGDETIKGPATVEQAARVLDLSTFPIIDGAVPSAQRTVANLAYAAPTTVKAAYEFHRKKLTEQKWKELPNSSITDQAASATFVRHGFAVSVSAYPNGTPGQVAVMVHNHGNVNLGELPRPGGTKPVYVGPTTAMFVTDAAVPAMAEESRKLLQDAGWESYGAAGDTRWFKQNAIRIALTVASAPAQGGKTMISYAGELMSADLPAPAEAGDLRYSDQTKELSFDSTENKDAVVAFYKTALGKSGWQPTLDKTVQIDDRDTMIFRNPAKDMLTLAMPPARNGRLSVSLQHQSAAEIAEIERLIKEKAPALRKELETRQAKEAAEFAEAHKPLPKIAIRLPAEAQGVEQSKDEIKFTVAHGKAKGLAETWRKEFRDSGWKEDVSTLDAMAGAISLSQEKQSLTIHYTDTGFTPAEIIISAMGAEMDPSGSE